MSGAEKCRRPNVFRLRRAGPSPERASFRLCGLHPDATLLDATRQERNSPAWERLFPPLALPIRWSTRFKDKGGLLTSRRPGRRRKVVSRVRRDGN